VIKPHLASPAGWPRAVVALADTAAVPLLLALSLSGCLARPPDATVPPPGLSATAVRTAPAGSTTTDSVAAGSRSPQLLAGAGAGECVVEVAGDVTHRLTGTTDGRVAPGQADWWLPQFLTRHWMSATEIDLTATAQTRPFETARAEEATAAADLPSADATASWLQLEGFLHLQAARTPPWFGLDCGARDDPMVLVRFLSTATRPDDLPMRPAVYTIPLAEVPWADIGGAAPAIYAQAIWIPRGTDGTRGTAWVIAEPGRFEIERFDRSEVSGRFSLDARLLTPEQPGDADRRVHLTGRFAFRCPPGAHCGQD
jgi:hypothetical protein